MGRDITQCHPRLQAKAKELISICASQGIHIKIGECFRTVAEQDALYAQGRTKPGKKVTNAPGSSYSSQHQWGIAFDFYLKMDVDGDGSTSDDAYNDSKGHFKKVATIAKGLGLAWGGDWKSIVDKPHLYLPDWGSGTGILKQQYGTFENFKKTWQAEVNTLAAVTELKEVKSGTHGLKVLASSLIIRKSPDGVDTGKRYREGQQVQPIRKCFYKGAPWFETADGWIFGKYLEGWVLQDSKWWYMLEGYTYAHNELRMIDGKYYCFDYEGWMLTSDRIKPSGEVILI